MNELTMELLADIQRVAEAQWEASKGSADPSMIAKRDQAMRVWSWAVIEQNDRRAAAGR